MRRAAQGMYCCSRTRPPIRSRGGSIRALRERRVDGLLVAQVPGSDPTLVDRLHHWRIPTVLLDRLGPDNVDQIGVENRLSMLDIVNHLVALGHRRIGYVGGDLRISVLAERRAGYLDALLGADSPARQFDRPFQPADDGVEIDARRDRIGGPTAPARPRLAHGHRGRERYPFDGSASRDRGARAQDP